MSYLARFFVSHPFSLPGTAPIALVSVMHIIQALMYLVWVKSGFATCMLAITWGLGSPGLPNDRGFIAFYLFLTAFLALAFFKVAHRVKLIFWFLPQHFARFLRFHECRVRSAT
jgi:hypothetical protein